MEIKLDHNLLKMINNLSDIEKVALKKAYNRAISRTKTATKEFIGQLIKKEVQLKQPEINKFKSSKDFKVIEKDGVIFTNIKYRPLSMSKFTDKKTLANFKKKSVSKASKKTYGKNKRNSIHVKIKDKDETINVRPVFWAKVKHPKTNQEHIGIFTRLKKDWKTIDRRRIRELYTTAPWDAVQNQSFEEALKKRVHEIFNKNLERAFSFYTKRKK